MNDTLDLSEYEQFASALAGWPDLALEAAEPALEQALLYLHGQLPEYPEPPLPSPDGVSFLNEKQRAWFFAAVQEGRVPGWQWVPAQKATASTPYLPGHPEKVGSARTGNLGRKFTESVSRADDAVLGQLGTNVPYAPWVVGPDYPGENFNGQTKYQARIHVGRWWQFEKIVHENLEGAWERFDRTFWPEFQQKITGGANA